MSRRGKSRTRKSKLRALGFQVEQPTELQTHLFRAEATLDAMMRNLRTCYLKNPSRMEYVLDDFDAKSRHDLAMGQFECVMREIRLALSAASVKA